MRKCLPIILLLICINADSSFAQDPHLLQQQYKAASTYKDRMYALDAIANYYTWTEGGLEKGRTYGHQMIALAEESKSKELLAQAYVLNGIRLVEAVATSKKEEELKAYFAKAIQIGKENNLPFYEAAAYIGLSGIQFHLVVADGDEMLGWGEKALALSTAIPNDSLRTMSLIAIAIGKQLKNDNLAAFHHFTDAIQVAETINDPYLLAYCYRAFARFYNYINDYDKALVHYARADKVLKEKKNLTYRDLHWLFMNQWNTTWAHNSKKEQVKARASANKLIEFSEHFNLPNTYRIAPLSQHLTLYITEGKFEEAKAFLERNPSLIPFYKNHDYETALYEQKANIYRYTGQYDSADYYYRLNLTVTDKSIPVWSAGVYGEYGNFLLERGKLTEAIQYLEEAKRRSEQFKKLDGLVAAYQDLDKAYYRAGNTEKAYAYKSLYIQSKDSLAQLSREKDLALLEVQQEQKKVEQEQREKQAVADYRNRMRIFGLVGGLGVLLMIAAILLWNNRQKQKANALLQKQKLETEQQRIKTEQALEELKSTQTQLVQREKMASLGELTAGIAHEIQNPLNFVNNFSEASTELIEELEAEATKDNKEEVIAIASDLKQNLRKITHHGRRAGSIVKSMMEHSRTAQGEKQATDINALTKEYLKLAYQGFRAKDSTFSVIIETHYDPSVGQVNVSAQEIGRVLLNLLNNAFYSIQQKKKLLNGTYEPLLQVSTRKQNGSIEVAVKDNGTGIPEKVLDKIYQPFFTTKPTGEGTGLGLSLSYDIVTKGHSGNLTVHSTEGEGAEFVVQLPINKPN